MLIARFRHITIASQKNTMAMSKECLKGGAIIRCDNTVP